MQTLRPVSSADPADGLQPRGVRREGRDQHPALGLGDLGEQPGVDAFLGARRLVLEDIGRIAHEREHAASPIAVSTSVLGASPITGVSSIFQSPVWKMLPNGVSISTPLPSGIECDSATKLTRNGPELDASAALDDVELDLAGQPLLLELAGDQPGGERRREQRRLQLLGEIGQRADMVLVAVGQDDPGEPLLLVLDELEIGQDEVDARDSRNRRRSGRGRP